MSFRSALQWTRFNPEASPHPLVTEASLSARAPGPVPSRLPCLSRHLHAPICLGGAPPTPTPLRPSQAAIPPLCRALTNRPLARDRTGSPRSFLPLGSTTGALEASLIRRETGPENTAFPFSLCPGLRAPFAG